MKIKILSFSEYTFFSSKVYDKIKLIDICNYKSLVSNKANLFFFSWVTN